MISEGDGIDNETKAMPPEGVSEINSCSCNEDVSKWAMTVPDRATLIKFEDWARKLSGIITDIKPKNEMLGTKSTWTSTSKAIALLGKVERY